MTEFELESSLNLAWHWARTLEYRCVQNLILSKPKQCEQSMKRISLPDSLSYCSISCCLKWRKGLTLSQSANICTKTCFSFLSFHKKVLLHIHCVERCQPLTCDYYCDCLTLWPPCYIVKSIARESMLRSPPLQTVCSEKYISFNHFLGCFWLITPCDSGLVQGDVWFRTKFDIEPLQCIVLKGV